MQSTKTLSSYWIADVYELTTDHQMLYHLLQSYDTCEVKNLIKIKNETSAKLE